MKKSEIKEFLQTEENIEINTYRLQYYLKVGKS